MKFEMEFGWTGNESVIITTFDFDKISILQKFVMEQETNGWCSDEYEDSDDLDLEFEDTEEELEGSESQK
jgi:hypothetical protein